MVLRCDHRGGKTELRVAVEPAVDDYDADPAHIAQTQMLLKRVEEAIHGLQTKRTDLDRTLKELRDIRAQCVEHLQKKCEL